MLAFTSHQRDGDVEKCIESGMDDYLPKEAHLPKWRSLLLEKLDEWLPQNGGSI